MQGSDDDFVSRLNYSTCCGVNLCPASFARHLCPDKHGPELRLDPSRELATTLVLITYFTIHVVFCTIREGRYKKVNQK